MVRAANVARLPCMEAGSVALNSQEVAQQMQMLMGDV